MFHVPWLLPITTESWVVWTDSISWERYASGHWQTITEVVASSSIKYWQVHCSLCHHPTKVGPSITCCGLRVVTISEKSSSLVCSRTFELNLPNHPTSLCSADFASILMYCHIQVINGCPRLTRVNLVKKQKSGLQNSEQEYRHSASCGCCIREVTTKSLHNCAYCSWVVLKKLSHSRDLVHCTKHGGWQNWSTPLKSVCLRSTLISSQEAQSPLHNKQPKLETLWSLPL